MKIAKIILNVFAFIFAFSLFIPASFAYVEESQGLKLYIPADVFPLLRIETSKDKNSIFKVSELASCLAAKKTGQDVSGAGWLFTISKVPKETLYNFLRNDMSGTELFAYKDGEYYLYNHPTDVRYMRENNEIMRRDQAIWTKLNEWAYKNVRKKFIADNNLKPPTALSGNSFIGAWHESIAGRGIIDIVKFGDAYKINIKWGESAFATSFWQMTAKFKNGALVYDDCEYKSVEFDGKGGEKIKRGYKNGKGEFTLIATGELLWNDFTDNVARDSVFLRNE